MVFVFAIRVTPGREIAPAPVTRRFRIGSDDLDAGFNYIRPIFYVFRISFAYQEDDGRGVGCAIVRKFSLPILWENTFIGESGNVIPQTEGHHVSLKTVNDGTRLLAGTTVGEIDGDISTGLFLPLGGKCRVDLLVQLTRGIVRNIQQLHLRLRLVCCRYRKSACCCQEYPSYH